MPRSFFMPLFSGVRGIQILRTSPLRNSANFALRCSRKFAYTAFSEVSAPRGAGPGAGAPPRCDGTRTPGRTRRSDQIVPFAR